MINRGPKIRLKIILMYTRYRRIYTTAIYRYACMICHWAPQLITNHIYYCIIIIFIYKLINKIIYKLIYKLI